MENKDEVIANICSYAERHSIKEMLQEYMKRVILHKPADVKAFLIETIERDPYISHGAQSSYKESTHQEQTSQPS